MINRLAWILTFSLFFTACKKDELNRVAEGRVLDAETMQPVDSAIVSMWVPSPRREQLAQQVYTDADGHFYFEAGTEDLDQSSLKISKPPYYYPGEAREFRYEFSDFLIYPKAFFQIDTEIENGEDQNWGLGVEFFEGGYRIGSTYCKSNHLTIFFPLKGNTSYQVQSYLFVDGSYQDTSQFEINIPYRDTLSWEYEKTL